MNFRIDEPENLEISEHVCEIRGWCTMPPFGPERVRFEIGGIPAPFTQMRRPDAEAAYPGQRVRGFVLHVDLTYYMGAIRGSALHLKIIAGEGGEADVRFQVSRAALGSCMAAACGL
jgi:hypothetical protein